MPVPVISVTDLYHPYQDPGDNFDLIAAYALPEIDLRAVVLDCTDPFRQPVAAPLPSPALYADANGPRDPGFIAVTQLNYIFDRIVPCGAGPFRQMRSPDDAMTDVPRFQQHGIELILETLRQSDEPVHIMGFGSARAIAAAYNRDPDLFARNGTVVELSGGASSAAFLEWNVALDPLAFARVLQSPLPVNIYPCATQTGPLELGTHNTYYSLPNLNFIENMAPELRRYLRFAFGRSERRDFLRAMDIEWSSPEAELLFARKHNVWETALWMHTSGRMLVKGANGQWRLVARDDYDGVSESMPHALLPCDISIRDDGLFEFKLINENAKCPKRIYYRPNPAAQEAALREALPELYRTFTTPSQPQ